MVAEFSEDVESKEILVAGGGFELQARIDAT